MPPTTIALPHAIHVAIDEAMRQRAKHDGHLRQMQRTRASPADAYIGTLGELVWAQLRYGSYAGFDTLHSQGKVDDHGSVNPLEPIVEIGIKIEIGIEIKTSKTRVSPHSHLMVREDYARRRQPDFYVLVLIPHTQAPSAERDAFVCGWASHAEVIARPPIERISTHTGRTQGFRCYEVAAADLHPLHELPFDLVGIHQRN